MLRTKVGVGTGDSMEHKDRQGEGRRVSRRSAKSVGRTGRWDGPRGSRSWHRTCSQALSCRAWDSTAAAAWPASGLGSGPVALGYQ